MTDGNEGERPENRLSGPSASTPSDDQHRCSCAAERLAPSTHPANWPNDDDPPPYASLVNVPADQHSVAWSSYVFPSPSPYEDSGGGSEGRTIARPLMAIPLTSYGIFKIGPPRYAQATTAATSNPLQRQLPIRMVISEPGPVVKSSSGMARKYGAILIAATVIIFLMALSLMVRFVVEKSLYRKT